MGALMPRGRPPTYRPEYADTLAEHLASGGKLASFARAINVARMSVWRWAKTHPDFASVLKGESAPPPVKPITAPPAFSLSAWGVPQPRPTELSRRSVPTEDDIDERLWQGVMA
jgi:hypothetical protein